MYPENGTRRAFGRRLGTIVASARREDKVVGLVENEHRDRSLFKQSSGPKKGSHVRLLQSASEFTRPSG